MISTNIPFSQLSQEYSEYDEYSNIDSDNNSDNDIEIVNNEDNNVSLLKNIIDNKNEEINKLKELLNIEYVSSENIYQSSLSCKDYYDSCKDSLKDILTKNTFNFNILMNAISGLKNSNNYISKLKNTYDPLSIYILFNTELQQLQRKYCTNKYITIPTFVNNNYQYYTKLDNKIFNGFWKTLDLEHKNKYKKYYAGYNFDITANAYFYPYISKYYKEIILDCVSDIKISTLVEKSNSLDELNYIFQSDFDIQSKHGVILSNIFKESKKIFELTKVNKCQSKILLPNYQNNKISDYSVQKYMLSPSKYYNNNTLELVLLLIFLGNRGQPYVFKQNLLHKLDVLYHL
jgi:hypothetical protein